MLWRIRRVAKQEPVGRADCHCFTCVAWREKRAAKIGKKQRSADWVDDYLDYKRATGMFT